MGLLKVENLKVSYGPVKAVHGVTFQVGLGETLALVGSNGSGKSSILKAIVGLVKSKTGEIRLHDELISGLPPYEIVGRGIGYSPEGRRVFCESSVDENLTAGGHLLPRDEVARRKERIFDYFPRLRDRSKQLAGSLSGGEQQMLAIGRALMPRPSLLILDEPSLGLAPVIVERIGDLLIEIQQMEDLSVLIAEQNAVWSLGIAQRGIVLEMGNITMSGEASTLVNDEYVQKAYLGT